VIREGRVSAVEAVDNALERIAAIDGELKAFITVDVDGARRAARVTDQRRLAGEELGPLNGVPFSVKDLLDTVGVRTTYGSRSLADNVPEVDVAAVARLRAAGAILIGKTATPEFAASMPTRSALNGITRNPWNRNHSPGGSSGGAGAAVAAGIGPLAVSTDGGGSARIPAAACGVLGLKPTLGRIPHETWPFHFSNNSSVSLNARAVEDLAVMLRVMSGPHPLDPWSRRPGPPLADWQTIVQETSERPAGRVLFIAHPAGLTADREVLASVEVTLAEIESAGYVVDRTETDPTEFDTATIGQVLAPNLVARARRLSPAQQSLLEEPLRSLVAGDRYRPDAVGLQEANLARSGLYERVEQLLGHYDLIVSPTVLAEPPLAEGNQVIVDGDEVPLLNWWGHLAVANMTGHPALSVPSGFTAAGLPVGIHAVGQWDGEEALLRFANTIAKARPWQHLWPPSHGG